MSQSVDDKIQELMDESQFNLEILNQLIFHYGFIRAKALVTNLRTYSSHYSIRVNTLVTTPDKLQATLKEKNILTKKHPTLEDCLLVEVTGPLELQQKSKIVTVKYSNSITNLLIGGNLGGKDFSSEAKIKVGDELTIVDTKGRILANGILMMDPEDIALGKKGLAIKTFESRYHIPNLKITKEYLRGQFLPQSLASIIIGAQIKLKAKDRVLDMNTGTGELLTYIWQRNSKTETKIIALNNSASQQTKFKETVKQLRMYKAPFESFHFKLRKFAVRFNKPETFDWIVIKAPNTSIGIRPKVFMKTSESVIETYNNMQRRYLEEAARLLKRNGTIFYYTDSILPAENEEMIRLAVEKLKLRIAKQTIFIGDKCTANFPYADNLQYLFPFPGQTRFTWAVYC
ncbi:MAG: PUA domain-containing protein [Candidatus Heimdallarchaeota archaeon]